MKFEIFLFNMDSSSSDTLDEEEDLQSLQKQLKQRKNERRQKILRKKSTVKLQPQEVKVFTYTYFT